MCFWIENRFFDWKINFSIKKTEKKNRTNTRKNSKIGVGGRREAPSIYTLDGIIIAPPLEPGGGDGQALSVEIEGGLEV